MLEKARYKRLTIDSQIVRERLTLLGQISGSSGPPTLNLQNFSPGKMETISPFYHPKQLVLNHLKFDC